MLSYPCFSCPDSRSRSVQIKKNICSHTSFEQRHTMPLGKKTKQKKKNGSTFFCTLLCVSFRNKLINLGLIKNYNLIVIQQQAFFECRTDG